MKYFAAFLPMLSVEKSQSLRSLHLDHLANARRKGSIFASGRFADGAGGLVIYQAENLDDAREIAKSDPYVANGARGLDLHEWEMVFKK